MTSSASATLLPAVLAGNGVLTLTLNHPASRNALSLAMMEAFERALAKIAADANVRCLILAAQGPAFCAGHDLRELSAARAASDGGERFFARTFMRCSGIMQALAALPQPVIAAVEGVATAAGCQLVGACDLAIAGESAVFCTPGVDIGLFCSTPAVALSRNVGRKHALEMLFTGDKISAQDAYRMGLVNRVTGAGEALNGAKALALKIANKPAAVMAQGKRTFYAQISADSASAYAMAGRAMVEGMLADDSIEGIGAFLEKRPAKWRDRAPELSAPNLSAPSETK